MEFDIEAVYRVVKEDGPLIGVWPADVVRSIGGTKQEAKAALLELERQSRVYSIGNAWYPGAAPTRIADRIRHAPTARLMMSEAWGFISERYPEEDWPPMMREGIEDFRKMFPDHKMFPELWPDLKAPKT